MSYRTGVPNGSQSGSCRDDRSGSEEIFVSPVSIFWIVFACVFGGALIGMALRRIVPEHHLSADSKDVIKMAMIDSDDGSSCPRAADRLREDFLRRAEKRNNAIFRSIRLIDR